MPIGIVLALIMGPKQTVTLSDFFTATTRLESAITKVLKVKATERSNTKQLSSLVTCDDLARELYRMKQFTKSAWTVTPNKKKLDAKFPIKTSKEVSPLAVALIEDGFAPTFGPLTDMGPSEPLTITQIGEALGYFMARLAEITHVPSQKFSPELKDG
ncbi:MAG: hypothetical protein JST40_04315 [Armatimonadetes bacterium]|nr:hypothetical protein [Armatimonadota bacterium]